MEVVPPPSTELKLRSKPPPVWAITAVAVAADTKTATNERRILCLVEKLFTLISLHVYCLSASLQIDANQENSSDTNPGSYGCENPQTDSPTGYGCRLGIGRVQDTPSLADLGSWVVGTDQLSQGVVFRLQVFNPLEQQHRNVFVADPFKTVRSLGD